RSHSGRTHSIARSGHSPCCPYHQRDREPVTIRRLIRRTHRTRHFLHAPHQVMNGTVEERGPDLPRKCGRGRLIRCPTIHRDLHPLEHTIHRSPTIHERPHKRCRTRVRHLRAHRHRSHHGLDERDDERFNVSEPHPITRSNTALSAWSLRPAALAGPTYARAVHLCGTTLYSTSGPAAAANRCASRT